MDHNAGYAAKWPVGDVPLRAGARLAAEVIAFRRTRLAGKLVTRLLRAGRP